jgi:hypothetical protein
MNVNLNAPKAKLVKTTKIILNQWESTKYSWRDQKSKEFEKEYLAALQDQVTGAMTVIEDLERILTKIRKDCE